MLVDLLGLFYFCIFFGDYRGITSAFSPDVLCACCKPASRVLTVPSADWLLLPLHAVCMGGGGALHMHIPRAVQALCSSCRKGDASLAPAGTAWLL